MPHQHHRGRAALPSAALAVLVLAAVPPRAAAQGSPLEPRVEAGACVTPLGSLVHRAAPGAAWHPLGPKAAVHSRDLVVALPGVRGALETKGGNLRLTLAGSLPESSGFPVLESAVVLHDTSAFDADITLQRGRVILTNRRKAGPARAWVRLPAMAWELTLRAPGDEAALEVLGRRPRGPYEKDPQRAAPPTMVVALHALKGTLTLREGTREHSLSAPPGPAYFHWDSLTGTDTGPRRRQDLPEWAAAEGKGPPGLAAHLKALTDFSRDDTVGERLATYLEGTKDLLNHTAVDARRRLAAYAMGATDDVQALTDALGDPKSAPMRAAAVEALRHWIGRTPGQELRLYRFLVERQEYSEPQAETVLQLLHSPFDAERPETYEALIAYLRHGRLPVRELARWHLYRLAPAGRKIAYDAGAPEAERLKGYEAWKKLVPSGKLPPDKAPDAKEKDG